MTETTDEPVCADHHRNEGRAPGVRSRYAVQVHLRCKAKSKLMDVSGVDGSIN